MLPVLFLKRSELYPKNKTGKMISVPLSVTSIVEEYKDESNNERTD